MTRISRTWWGISLVWLVILLFQVYWMGYEACEDKYEQQRIRKLIRDTDNLKFKLQEGKGINE